jgi:mannose-1-phosphate guanylyltransferase
MSSSPIPGFYAVVPAGGAGTRLWPLSRAGNPKFLLDLTGSGRTLIQQTWDRLLPLAGADHLLVVTGCAHAVAVADQLAGLAAANLLAEPSPRDSAAAIGLAAAVVAQRRPDAVVGSFAADHVVRDVPAFHAAVREAVATARTGPVVTIGIEPTFASTAFGYVQAGEALAVEGAPSARRVTSFVEKPSPEVAAGYLADGGYRWNAGMFVARADVLLGELARHRPRLHAGLLELAGAWDTPRRDAVLDAVWPGLERVAIDYAVAEPAATGGRVAMIPAEFGWDDIGDFASLADLLPDGGAGGVRVLGETEQVVVQDAGGVVVATSGRLVAVLGLDDVIVVDTPDALLVTTRKHVQDVKSLVERVRARGRTDLA